MKMKISGKQLEMVLSKLKYAMVGYNSGSQVDFEVEISITKEDPGTGSMVDCFTLESSKAEDSEVDKTEKMTIEVYPASEKLEPRASKIETFKITEKNRY